MRAAPFVVLRIPDSPVVRYGVTVSFMTRRMTISDREVRTMLRIVTNPDDPADDPDRPLPWSVLHGLRDLIRCDGVSFFRLDSGQQTVTMFQGLADNDDYHSPDQVADLERGFWTHYPHSQPCSYPDLSGDLTSVTTFSDFYSQRQLRATGMYAEYFRHFAAEREIMLCLPSPRYRTVRLMLYRGRGLDFSDRDRALLTILRPHLHAAFLVGIRGPAPDLTPRQIELLKLVADGHTNRQIARRLMVADSTVRKHMENIFERLQVSNRAAAVARVFGAQPAE
jgi:DNA-binding CsgD family transcriptional regulator